MKDTIGFGYGIGECLEYSEYLAKKPSPSALRAALIKLGNKPDSQGKVHDLFWGGTAKTRECAKYIALNE